MAIDAMRAFEELRDEDRDRFSPTVRAGFTPQSFHLIEHPIEGICSAGPWPVSATCFIASKRSRWAFATGVMRDASSRPRYCNSSCELVLRVEAEEVLIHPLTIANARTGEPEPPLNFNGTPKN